jgi:hypothetical protein
MKLLETTQSSHHNNDKHVYACRWPHNAQKNCNRAADLCPISRTCAGNSGWSAKNLKNEKLERLRDSCRSSYLAELYIFEYNIPRYSCRRTQASAATDRGPACLWQPRDILRECETNKATHGEHLRRLQRNHLPRSAT